MTDEPENSHVGEAPKDGFLKRIRSTKSWRAWRRSGIRRSFYSKKASAWATLIAWLTNVTLVLLISFQNYYQRGATDRQWSAQQIAIIFDKECFFKPDGTLGDCRFKASDRSRENAVRAYVDVKGHEGAARLADANLSGFSLAGVDFSYVDLSSGVLAYTILDNANFTGSILIGANLQNVLMNNANLRNAIMTGAYLEGADLQGADLREARMEKVILGSCDNPIVDLGTIESYTAADLREADLRGAVLTGAALCEVDLSGADLTGVIGLNEDDLKRARGNEKTKLPLGIKMPERWLKRKDAEVSRGLEQENGKSKHPVPNESRPPQ